MAELATFGAIILALHILCGVTAILLGLAAMKVRKSRGCHTTIGEIYHWLFVGLFISASLLSFRDWHRLWWFVPVAAFSYAFALLGYLAAKFRWHNWLRFHLAGQGGSFIAMSTAVLVVNLGTGSWWAWVLPTIIGTPIIAWITREVVAGRRPKYV